MFGLFQPSVDKVQEIREVTRIERIGETYMLVIIKQNHCTTGH